MALSISSTYLSDKLDPANPGYPTTSDSGPRHQLPTLRDAGSLGDTGIDKSVVSNNQINIVSMLYRVLKPRARLGGPARAGKLRFRVVEQICEGLCCGEIDGIVVPVFKRHGEKAGKAGPEARRSR